MPTSPFFLLGSICENIFPRFNLAPPIFKRRVAFFTKNRSFNTEKMRNMLGFEHQYDCNRGLIETAEWYVKSRLL
jgi:dihydroflavonol-4-reductase